MIKRDTDRYLIKSLLKKQKAFTVFQQVNASFPITSPILAFLRIDYFPL
jgi:hypothetical protein